MSSNFSPVGVGTSHIASLGSRISLADATKLIAKALESNVTVIDTSDTYGSGDVERMVGKAISGMRDYFFIMTKAGFPYIALPEFLSALNQVGKKLMQKSDAKKTILKSTYFLHYREV